MPAESSSKHAADPIAIDNAELGWADRKRFLITDEAIEMDRSNFARLVLSELFLDPLLDLCRSCPDMTLRELAEIIDRRQAGL